MGIIHAIYDKGVFRPIGPVQLPDQCEVEFEPRVMEEDLEESARVREGVRRILSERYESGEHDVAERHNEHQP